VGIAQRPERIVGLGVPTLLFGAGPQGWLLLGLMAALAVVNIITVIQRVAHVYRLTVPATSPGRAAGASAVLADPVPKGK
jgi:hypothetical protein